LRTVAYFGKGSPLTMGSGIEPTQKEQAVITIIESGSNAWAVAATNRDLHVYSREQAGEWNEVSLTEDTELDQDGGLILEALYEEHVGHEPNDDVEEPEAEAEDEGEEPEEDEPEDVGEPEDEEGEDEEQKPRRRRARTTASRGRFKARAK